MHLLVLFVAIYPAKSDKLLCERKRSSIAHRELGWYLLNTIANSIAMTKMYLHW